MKKLISICIVMAVVFGLVGCKLLPNNDSNIIDDPGNISQNTDATDSEINETDPVIEETQGDVSEPEKDDGSIHMDQDMQHRINLFLSRFAEAQITQYPCCDYHKLRFAVEHCRINGLGDLEYTDNNIHISKATVDSILNTYTGSMISENSDYNQYVDCTGSGSTITFSEDFYDCPAGPEANSIYIAVVDRMYENEDGTYQVNYHVYEFDSDFDSYDFSGIYKYTADEAIYDWNLTVRYEAEAVVRDYLRSDGQASYQLISIKTVE